MGLHDGRMRRIVYCAWVYGECSVVLKVALVLRFGAGGRGAFTGESCRERESVECGGLVLGIRVFQNICFGLWSCYLFGLAFCAQIVFACRVCSRIGIISRVGRGGMERRS